MTEQSNTYDKFLTRSELAARLEVSVFTLDAWNRKGKGPRRTMLAGRVPMYSIDEVIKFEKEKANSLTKDQLAKRWKLSIRTLDNWHKDGEGPARMSATGKSVRYSMDEVIRYEQQHMKDGAQ